jgi:tripartite-type tricarboxylate transporter receptor subunit TctC
VVSISVGKNMTRAQASRFAVIVAIGLSAQVADAQEWPARPVHIVVPYARESAADILGRLLADQLTVHFKQDFVVENSAGEGGVVGSEAVANAKPDGYIFVLSGLGSHVISPTAHPNPRFDPLNSFTHVAYVVGTPIVIVANPSFGVKSFEELRAKLKRSARATSYISGGTGTLGNLLMASWARKERIKLAHVSSRGPIVAVANPVIAALNWTQAVTEIGNKTVVPLAVSSAKRMPQFPNVPTLKELGYPDLVATNWYALAGPAGLPADITRTLNNGVAAALDTPRVRERLAIWGMSTEKMSSGEVTAFVASELRKWGPLVGRLATGGSARR